MNNREYNLESLPEPKDCKPGEYYLVRDIDGETLIAERWDTNSDYQWRTFKTCYVDEEVTILARMTSDREVPNT